MTHGKSCVYKLHGCCGRRRQDGSLILSFLNFSDEELGPKTENDLCKVIVELGLELE